MATKSSGQLAAGPNNQRASETTSAPSSGQTQKTGTRLLLDDRPLILLPTLAALVGVDQAIVLQQLHYRVKSTGGREIDGQLWYYSTYEQWQAEDFPFWSWPTIRNLFQALEKQKLIISCQPEGRKSRRKYYRIDHDKLDEALAHAHTPGTNKKCSFERTKTVPSLSKETFCEDIRVSSSSANAYEEKRGVANAGAKATNHALFPDVPRLPFPKSARAMYKTLDRYSDVLDRYDVNADPDRDGNFFKDFSSRDWCYPSGRVVDNWLVAYIKRRQYITERILEA